MLRHFGAIFLLVSLAINCTQPREEQTVFQEDGEGGLPEGATGAGISAPGPGEGVWVLKSITTREADDAIIQKSVLEYAGGQLVKISQRTPTDDAGEIETGAVEYRYMENAVEQLAAAASEADPDVAGAWRMELDDERRIETVTIFQIENPRLPATRAELEYEGELRKPNRVVVTQYSADGDPLDPPVELLYQYDERGYLTRVVRRGPAAGGAVTERSLDVRYDDEGFVRRHNRWQGLMLQRRSRFTNSFDAAGRLEMQSKEPRLGAGQIEAIKYTYDADGNLESRCEDDDNDGMDERCFDYEYIQLPRRPLLDDLIIPKPLHEAIQGMPFAFLTGFDF